jgi:transmembrane sensor
MERRIRSRFNNQIYEEACEWFIECRTGDLQASMRLEFDRWIRKSPEHLSAYLEIAAIWDEGSSLDPTHEYDRARLIADAVEKPDNVVSLAYTSDEETRQRSSQRSGSAAVHGIRSWRRAAIAASVAALAVMAAMLAWVEAYPGTAYSTTIGEQRSLAFADGSTVTLNSHSRIRVHYTARGRDVVLLAGQALFHVAKDASRPFIVKSGSTRVRAVGTEFDVYQRREDTVVTVVEGRVAVLTEPPFTGSSGAVATVRQPTEPGSARSMSALGGLRPPSASPVTGANVFVSAGEQLTVSPKAAEFAEHPNIASATAWVQRELIFDSASLADVAEQFNRYNEQQLVIVDPSLEVFHISGVFSSTDPSSLVRFLRERPGLRVVETPTEIRIEKNK